MRYWRGSSLLDRFEGFAPQKPYTIEEDQDLICTILKAFYFEKGPDRDRNRFVCIVTDGVLHMPLLVHPNKAIDVFWPDRKFSKDNLSELEGRQILITSFALTAVISESVSLPYMIGMNWRPMKIKKQSIDPTVKCLWKDPLVLHWMDEYRELKMNAPLSNDPDIKSIERRFGDIKSVNLDLQNVLFLFTNENDISETTLVETATVETTIAETTIIETAQEFAPAAATINKTSSQTPAIIDKQSFSTLTPVKRLSADKTIPPQNKKPRVDSSIVSPPTMNNTTILSPEKRSKINTQNTPGKIQKGKNKVSITSAQSTPLIHKLGSNEMYNYKDIRDRTEIDLLRSIYASNSNPFQQQSAYSLLCNLRYSQHLGFFEHAQRN